MYISFIRIILFTKLQVKINKYICNALKSLEKSLLILATR